MIRAPLWIGKVWAKGRQNVTLGVTETLLSEKTSPVDIESQGKVVSHSKYIIDTMPHEIGALVNQLDGGG